MDSRSTSYEGLCAYALRAGEGAGMRHSNEYSGQGPISIVTVN